MKRLQLKTLMVTCFLAVCHSLASGQITETAQITQNVIQYEKAEWVIKLNTTWTNPYDASEIALNMRLKAPSGKEFLLPCFYVSGRSGEGSVWKSRFAARDTGDYTFWFEFLKKNKVVETTEQDKFLVMASDHKGFLGPNDLWTFRYDNGDLFRGIGENICWESRDEDDSKHFEGLHENPRFNYEYMLKKLAANGGNFFRTWMIYWNLPVDWKKVKNNRRYQNTSSSYNESGMRRMDRLTELCDSLGIHMMLALESHAGLLDTGWELSNYNILNGGPAKSPLEFFTLPEARNQYKNKLRLMVARYGYSRSIAAWEFFNEIDNVMYQGKPEDRIPDSVITSWHDEMSSWLKLIDPYDHMVTTSISHRDVEGMNDLKNINFNQRHIYKSTSSIPSTLINYSERHGKPFIIGEFGYEWDWSKNFNDFADEMDNDFRRGLWYGLFSPTPVMPMSWWWEFFENRGMMTYFKNVRMFSDHMLNSCEGNFELTKLRGSNDGFHTYGVRCAEQVFVYIYNSTSNPGDIVITGEDLPASDSDIRIYNCETGKFGSARISSFTNTMKVEDIQLQPKSGIVILWQSSSE